MCNAMPTPSYNWSSAAQREEEQWLPAPVTTDADGSTVFETGEESLPLREKNSRGDHVPGAGQEKAKHPQAVARRNARERRRVQAVNGAFLRLKKAVPFENSRGKRISKVKTLQNAIDYIHNLQELLRRDGLYSSTYEPTFYYDEANMFLERTDMEESLKRNHCSYC